ncbi:hypothetical protein L1987_71130 [Smallanthus sonchifolius]|uniref:Uncharacterized protein n=1 Tax=Smallanthus sonchifolius TaxID=185202 RepID=A0ACB9ASY3_9ASTR|nr:hypothetical protein L1987_71130 [Smallanthus sonchifolius]
MEQRGYGQEYINRYMMTRKLLLNSSFLMVPMDMVYELPSTSTEYVYIPILGCRLRTSVHFPVPSHSCTRRICLSSESIRSAFKLGHLARVLIRSHSHLGITSTALAATTRTTVCHTTLDHGQERNLVASLQVTLEVGSGHQMRSLNSSDMTMRSDEH